MERKVKWWAVSYKPVLEEMDGVCVGGVVLGVVLIVYEVVLSGTDGASGQMSE